MEQKLGLAAFPNFVYFNFNIKIALVSMTIFKTGKLKRQQGIKCSKREIKIPTASLKVDAKSTPLIPRVKAFSVIKCNCRT